MLDQKEFWDTVHSVPMKLERMRQSNQKLTPAELTHYRSLVGQLAWPARETMPRLAYAVSDLQQKTSGAIVKDLVHVNRVLTTAKNWAFKDNQCLIFRPISASGPSKVGLEWTRRRYQSGKEDLSDKQLGVAAVHDAGFMGQPNGGSQQGYAILISSTDLYDGVAQAHLVDWGSSKIHRKVKSTLAAEAASCQRAYDRAIFARVMIYEIEHGLQGDWHEMCKRVPFSLGTDCKSLYDLCVKEGSIPEERRVALDLLDVRDGVERYGDRIRWVPTDHMLVDCLTKQMHPALLLQFLATGVYSLKYDQVIADTKRSQLKLRKAAREAAGKARAEATGKGKAQGNPKSVRFADSLNG